jgi:hypothetical protein
MLGQTILQEPSIREARMCDRRAGLVRIFLKSDWEKVLASSRQVASLTLLSAHFSGRVPGGYCIRVSTVDMGLTGAFFGSI